MSTFNDAPYSYAPGSNRLLGPVNLSSSADASGNSGTYKWTAKSSMECDATECSRSTPFYQYSAGEGGSSAPANAPSIPVIAQAPTTTSITVFFTVATVGGNPPPEFSILYGETTAPITPFPATKVSPQLALYTATVSGLTPSTTYYFKSVALNVYGAKISNVSAGISTAGSPPPAGSLKTNVVCPFLIQGPRFNTAATTAVDYYLNVDAVGAVYEVGGSTATGQQVYAAMYAGTAGADGNVSGDPGNPVPYAGACTADQVFTWLKVGGTGSQTQYSDTYLQGVQTALSTNGRLLACWGGFYADILGLFGPYQPTDYPVGFTNPAAADVVRSFLYNYCGITAGNTNPLGWLRQNSNNTSSYATYFQGLVLDFENVSNSSPINNYPVVAGGPAQFPRDAASAQYAPYKQALADIVTTYYGISPTLFLGNAPISLSIVGDCGGLGTPNNLPNICAPNTALNTWFPFPTATVPPTAAAYNTAASLALNHPEQMSYFDDIFVQFYNTAADYYIGGQYFANLLACWGYTALQAQTKGRKKTTINIGLCRGNIIPGGPAPFVANAQGAPAHLGSPPNDSANPPYTYWYPQYCEASPPNYTASDGWPNTSPIKDPANLKQAFIDANTILQTITGNSSLVLSDWCSGMGFWAGTNATLEAQKVYTLSDADCPGAILPALQTYCWSDADYPAPDPQWPGNVPIVNRLA